MRELEALHCASRGLDDDDATTNNNNTATPATSHHHPGHHQLRRRPSLVRLALLPAARHAAQRTDSGGCNTNDLDAELCHKKQSELALRLLQWRAEPAVRNQCDALSLLALVEHQQAHGHLLFTPHSLRQSNVTPTWSSSLLQSWPLHCISFDWQLA